MPATFFGKHNRSKVLAFAFLADAADRNGGSFTCREIAEATNLPLKSVSTLIRKWSAWWNYLSRTTGISDDGRPCYRYKIRQKGQRYLLEQVPDNIFMDALTVLQNIKRQRISNQQALREALSRRLEAKGLRARG